jgi:mono/diheme cytochrome c family protein
LIVEDGEGSIDARDALEEEVLGRGEPLGRMLALRALHALQATRRRVVLAALDDPDARVQLAAVRVSEPWVAANDPEFVERVVATAPAPSASGRGEARLRHQVLLTLGATRSRNGDALLAALLAEDAATPEARSAVISGLYERELGFLDRLLQDPAWLEQRAGRTETLRALARCVVREGRDDRLRRLVELAGSRPAEAAWQAQALVAGMLDGRPIGPDGKPGFIRISQPPLELAGLAELEPHLAWPGKPGTEELQVRPLEPEERARFDRGGAIYASVCTQCHLSGGTGGPGLAPPLRGSEWALGPKERVIRVVLHGLDGPILVGGTEWDLDMPAYAAGDEDLAAVLTYVRREWGQGGEPVTPAEVSAVRAAEAGRGRPWTAEELRRFAE